MNERIQELAQQSQLAELYDRYVEQCMKNADDDILDYDVIVKEFAELIVRECAHVAVFKDSGTVATAAVAGHMAAGRSIAAKLIKQHFGVEE